MGGAARERGAEGPSRIFAEEYGLEGSRVAALFQFIHWIRTGKKEDVVPVERYKREELEPIATYWFFERATMLFMFGVLNLDGYESLSESFLSSFLSLGFFFCAECLDGGTNRIFR